MSKSINEISVRLQFNTSTKKWEIRITSHADWGTVFQCESPIGNPSDMKTVLIFAVDRLIARVAEEEEGYLRIDPSEDPFSLPDSIKA